jgi:hypothetical protein
MKPEIIQELEGIRKQGNGILHPDAVVRFAEQKKSALHDMFEWDDSKAGEAHRLWQARQIISLELVIIDKKTGDIIELALKTSKEEWKEVRKYISLPIDRGNSNDKGYRSLNDVFHDPALRTQMLEQAKKDMKTFREKYECLTELAGVFVAMGLLSC